MLEFVDARLWQWISLISAIRITLSKAWSGSFYRTGVPQIKHNQRLRLMPFEFSELATVNPNTVQYCTVLSLGVNMATECTLSKIVQYQACLNRGKQYSRWAQTHHCRTINQSIPLMTEAKPTTVGLKLLATRMPDSGIIRHTILSQLCVSLDEVQNVIQSSTALLHDIH